MSNATTKKTDRRTDAQDGQGHLAVPIALVVLLIGVPLLLSPFDFWDGRILDHALETNQIAGVHNWFTTSGWHLQYLVFAVVQTIAEAANLPGDLMLRLIAIGSLAGLTYEAVRFAADTVKLPKVWALVAGATVAVFPAWNTLLSSVLFMYVLCVWLVFLGIRLFHHSNRWAAILGGIILIVSLQLNSNFVFSIALAAAYFACAWVDHGTPRKNDFTRLSLVIVISVSCFFLLKSIFVPSGIYAEYNQIDISLSSGFFVGLAKETIRYLQYTMVVTVTLLGVHMILQIAAFLRPAHTPVQPRPSVREGLAKSSFPLVVALFLIGAAAFPYVIVGKPADLRSMFDWNPRHTFLMAVPLGIFVAALARLLVTWATPKRSRFWFLPTAATLILLAVVQMAATWDKLSRSAYEAGIIAALTEIPRPGAGLVKLVVPNFKGKSIRYYESNWLLYQAYGREDWHSTVVSQTDDAIFIPSWLNINKPILPAYKSKHIMRSFRNECSTTLLVTGDPISGLAVVIWIFGGQLASNIAVEQTEATCGLRQAAPV